VKNERSALVSRVDGFVSMARNQPFFIGGVGISQTNRVIFTRMVEAWLHLIEDLMVRQCLSYQSRVDRMNNFIGQLFSEDILDTLAFLDSCVVVLINYEPSSFDTFKQYLARELSSDDLKWGLISPVLVALHEHFSAQGEERAHLLSTILQFLRFPKKLVLLDIGLEDQAIQEYLETEGELGAVVLNDDEMLDGISAIIKDWFGSFSLDDLRPKHGSGSVAEGPLTLAEKFNRMKIDDTIKIVLRNPSFEFSYQDYFPDPPGEGLDRCSRTIFVPKTALKLRTISMEPIALQYLQQGVMYALYSFIAQHPYMGVRIRLDDQSQNQVLAMEGSIYQNYGTIDLSHASDSVSWCLVRRVFKSVPLLYKWLLATRSRETCLPDGSRLQLRKFAPMGSALCFPIECILFAAIVEYASRKVCRQSKQPMALYSVYGDDLVVQSTCYDEIIKTLVACGFSVNTSKSYNTGFYRESCGKEYYAGIDISALYYRVPYYSGRPSPSAYGSWCSSANNAYVHRLPLYRLYLIHKIQSVPLKYGPWFGPSPNLSPYLYSSQPTNFHLKFRWNKNYQRYEARFTSVISRPRSTLPDDDRISYFIKLVEMSKRYKTSRHSDDRVLPYALHGCIELFSSSILPMHGFVEKNLLDATDWWDT